MGMTREPQPLTRQTNKQTIKIILELMMSFSIPQLLIPSRGEDLNGVQMVLQIQPDHRDIQTRKYKFEQINTERDIY